jgi:hypothetical protein
MGGMSGASVLQAVMPGGNPRRLVVKFRVKVAAAQFVVGAAHVMPEIVRSIDPERVAAHADQGQEELEDEDRPADGGADHKHVSHGLPSSPGRFGT